MFLGFDLRPLIDSNELRRNLSENTEKFKHFFLMSLEDMNLLNSETMMNIFGTYTFYFVRINILVVFSDVNNSIFNFRIIDRK